MKAPLLSIASRYHALGGSTPVVPDTDDFTLTLNVPTNMTPGWQGTLKAIGQSTGGTFDFGYGAKNDPTNAKVKLTVTSPGYTDAGVATTVNRTLYGTRVMRQPYPNEASLDLANNASDLDARIGFSEYLYAADTNPKFEVVAGFYDNGTPTVRNWEVPFTNASTLTYQAPIANWSWPPERATSSTLTLRVVAFHPYGQQGRPVRAVKFTVEDESANTATATVTTPTISAGFGDEYPVIEYVATIDISGLDQGELLSCDFEAFPWIGNVTLDTSDGVFSQPTPRYATITLVNDRTGAYGGGAAVVDSSSGNDGTGVVVARSAFDSGSPPAAYATIKGAAAIATYNNTNYSRNDVGASTIYLRDNAAHAWVGGSGSYGVANKDWLTVTSFPGESASITSQSGNNGISEMVKLEGLTLNGAMRFSTMDYLWIHDCTVTDLSDFAAIFDVENAYITHCSIANIDQGIAGYGTSGDIALVRGCNVTETATTVAHVLLGNKLSGTVANGKASIKTACNGQIVAFNFISVNGAIGIDFQDRGLTSWAIVQNIVEQRNNAQGCIHLYDNSTFTATSNGLVAYNTSVGAKNNYLYLDNGTTSVDKHLVWFIGNVFEDGNLKSDTFATASGNRLGNWAPLHSVGWYGNHIAEVTGVGSPGNFLNEFDGLWSVVNDGVAAWTDNKSASGDGLGMGDYHLTASSPVKDVMPDRLLPYDLAGNARLATGGAAGAYEYSA